ncbi:MAG: putative binding protein [Streptosporangiaceae bacterium]|nr:putative binding protein [Streptosporangiaceae bacterium]
MSSSTDPEDTDPVLEDERDHLTASRHALAEMRANVLALEAMGADPISTESLKATLYYRAEALRDDPDVPLFFGRLDYITPAERLYVGRRHVQDGAGEPLVIDWRAPLSRAFYKAGQNDPMGLALRRRFGFDRGRLTAYEDEDFTTGATGGTGEGRILIDEIERPRVGPMRDIVATIQPEQDDIVRADLDQTICVQGAPGTGKTAVGLHRIAYLLYAYRERIRRGGVLVVGPSASFLGYIKGVLPALGEIDVKQVTVADLVGAVPIRGDDTAEAARIKGDARMAEVLRHAVWSHVRTPAESLVLPRGSRRWRIPAHELAELVDALRARGVRYGAGRELLAHRIAHAVLVRIEEAGEACDDRTHDAIRRSRPVRAAVDQIWPAVDPVRAVLGLLSSAEALRAAAEGVLDPAEQAAILWARPARGPKSARWSLADAALIDEAADLVERTPSLGHVVIDEAQDLSPMQCRAIGRRCATGSATVLGDIAQGTTPAAATDWTTLLGQLGKPGARLQVLEQGYRVPRQIIEYAGRLLPHIAPELAPPTSVRQVPGALEVRAVPPEKLTGAVVLACQEALAGFGSVGLIAADDRVPDLSAALEAGGLEHVRLDATGELGGARLVLTPASQVKGLEFDHVVVAEPAEIVDAEPLGLRRLYVVLTRAVTHLCVLHGRPLPGALA